MTTHTDMIECLRDTTPFCDDVIKLILDYSTPKTFQVNKIYTAYHSRSRTNEKELFFVSKINKKSIRREGRCCYAINRIPLEDFISLEYDKSDHRYLNLKIKNKDYKDYYDKKYDILNRGVDEYLVYHDDKYLYYVYNEKGRFGTYKLKQDETGQEYIWTNLTGLNPIYPMDEADIKKYTFLNIPPHLYKYF
jgi:hypothetical protein